MTAGRRISTDVGRPDYPRTFLLGAANMTCCVYLDFAQVQCVQLYLACGSTGLATRMLPRRFWKEESAAAGERAEYAVGWQTRRLASGHVGNHAVVGYDRRAQERRTRRPILFIRPGATRRQSRLRRRTGGPSTGCTVMGRRPVSDTIAMRADGPAVSSSWGDAIVAQKGRRD